VTSRIAAAVLVVALVAMPGAVVAGGKPAQKSAPPAAAPGKNGPARPAAASKPITPPSNVDQHVQLLQSRYDTTADFTADFTQSVDVPTLGKTLDSSGKVFFKRPGRMRWEFVEPEKQTIVADGATLWVYQPEHRQVLKAPFRAAFQSTTPLSFLFGVGKLSEDFDASLISTEGDRVRLRLEPKQDTEIGTIVLTADRRSYDIAAAEITDPLGNVTRLTFTNLKRGVGLQNTDFVFHVPDGVDIVESPGAEPGTGG
jgi:outer membrane lipoprotein carrier protein